MDKDTEKKLNDSGWEVECYSPLKICHTDGSFATSNAAKIVIWDVLTHYESGAGD